MGDRVRSSPPPRLPAETPAEVAEAHDVIRFIFSAMIDAGLSQAEFARLMGVSESTIENWRNPKKFEGDPRGPGLVHIARALRVLGHRLDVRRALERKGRFSPGLRTDLAEIKRDRIRRGESFDEWRARTERIADDARRRGQIDG